MLLHEHLDQAALASLRAPVHRISAAGCWVGRISGFGRNHNEPDPTDDYTFWLAVMTPKRVGTTLPATHYDAAGWKTESVGEINGLGRRNVELPATGPRSPRPADSGSEYA
jgi:hypothetical protein